MESRIGIKVLPLSVILFKIIKQWLTNVCIKKYFIIHFSTITTYKREFIYILKGLNLDACCQPLAIMPSDPDIMMMQTAFDVMINQTI